MPNFKSKAWPVFRNKILKFDSKVDNKRKKKTGQSITIGSCERVSKAFGSTCETSRYSFKTDIANLSFFIQIFCACTSYGI